MRVPIQTMRKDTTKPTLELKISNAATGLTQNKRIYLQVMASIKQRQYQRTVTLGNANSGGAGG